MVCCHKQIGRRQPTPVMRDGEMASRLAHNQETPGSIPGPANRWSPSCPDGVKDLPGPDPADLGVWSSLVVDAGLSARSSRVRIPSPPLLFTQQFNREGHL